MINFLVRWAIYIMYARTIVCGYRFSSNYGSKTTYESSNFAFYNSPMHSQRSSDTDSHKHGNSAQDSVRDWPDHCKPVQLNALIRHGIRNPGQKDMDRFSQFVENLKLTNIKATHPALYSSFVKLDGFVQSFEQKSLLPQGRIEQRSLAQDIFKKYSMLLDHVESEDVHLVASTSQRTIDSCEAFISGWQQEMNSVVFNPELHINNSLIRFFDTCNKYVKEVEERKRSLHEYHDYQQNNFHKIADKIHKKFDWSKELTLSIKTLKSLYIMAAIEIAALETDEIGHIFDEEDMAILEYASDLKHYWKKSYGYDINYKQSCPLLMDIFQHLELAVQNKKHYKSILRFGHAETLLPLQALLGLFKDEPKLRSGNHEIHRDRQFKSSRISPFSSNINFVLFECDTGGDVQDRHLVQLVINGKPMLIPGCKHILCPFAEFKEQYENILESCDFESICMLDKHEEL